PGSRIRTILATSGPAVASNGARSETSSRDYQRALLSRFVFVRSFISHSRAAATLRELALLTRKRVPDTGSPKKLSWKAQIDSCYVQHALVVQMAQQDHERSFLDLILLRGFSELRPL